MKKDLGFISANSVNIRKLPDINSKKIGSVSIGSIVKIISDGEKKDTIDGMKNSWILVEFNDLKGFIFGSYVTPIRSTGLGNYKFFEKNNNESHFIKLYLSKNILYGEYYGTEDSGGHGIFYYKASLRNIFISKENILSFEIPTRKLYTFPLFKNKRIKMVKDSGISKDRLIYHGSINESALKLRCKSEYNSCWTEEAMIFTKIYDEIN